VTILSKAAEGIARVADEAAGNADDDVSRAVARAEDGGVSRTGDAPGAGDVQDVTRSGDIAGGGDIVSSLQGRRFLGVFVDGCCLLGDAADGEEEVLWLEITSKGLLRNKKV